MYMESCILIEFELLLISVFHILLTQDFDMDKCKSPEPSAFVRSKINKSPGALRQELKYISKVITANFNISNHLALNF